jgi:general secretion pathway protein G
MKKNQLFGFTLIEILVVVTIIGLLLSGGLISYSQLIKQARDNRRKTDLEQIRSALEMYRSQNNVYPTIAAGDCQNLLPILTPFIPKMPDDPRPTPYSYYCSSTNTSYTISAYLETVSGSCGIGCGTTCTYSVGPYGQTCP